MTDYLKKSIRVTPVAGVCAGRGHGGGAAGTRSTRARRSASPNPVCAAGYRTGRPRAHSATTVHGRCGAASVHSARSGEQSAFTNSNKQRSFPPVLVADAGCSSTRSERHRRRPALWAAVLHITSQSGSTRRNAQLSLTPRLGGAGMAKGVCGGEKMTPTGMNTDGNLTRDGACAYTSAPDGRHPMGSARWSARRGVADDGGYR